MTTSLRFSPNLQTPIYKSGSICLWRASTGTTTDMDHYHWHPGTRHPKIHLDIRCTSPDGSELFLWKKWDFVNVAFWLYMIQGPTEDKTNIVTTSFLHGSTSLPLWRPLLSSFPPYSLVSLVFCLLCFRSLPQRCRWQRERCTAAVYHPIFSPDYKPSSSINSLSVCYLLLLWPWVHLS